MSLKGVSRDDKIVDVRETFGFEIAADHSINSHQVLALLHIPIAMLTYRKVHFVPTRNAV